MAFLYSSKIRKILLAIILSWGTISFYITNSQNFGLIVVIILLTLIGYINILKESSPIYLLILNSFLVSFSLYTMMFQYNLPNWLLMLAALIIFGYLFTYTEQKIGILGNQRLIYLVLFSLITVEVFLSLSYFLINPLSLSLIIATTSYFFIGFCYTILAKHEDTKFATYIIISIFVVTSIFLTSRWGGLV